MKQPLPRETIQILDAIAGVLLRCFIFTVVALLSVWTVILAMGDLIYQIHTIWFDIPRKEFDLFLLYSLTFIKTLNVVFFLIPFLAIRHFLRSNNDTAPDTTV
ncbi:hypothetical protein DENIS_3077 [Desulfonema ishimotonii]|uniref:DUF6868 domain-containing protein n=1 Tax=Desulfonema ishimotonii TaxID=45657 RepID=A0A401FYS4_9BACT|nr:hypothetical protein [Desulfonema ishimotonii]GBC62114.1 hypothetical protein DENIS_3077 [Desulfonema ishimotonii]